MGLPRPPEAFHRLYSAPEPPPQKRRPRVVGVLAAVVVLLVGAIGYVAYDRRAAPQTTANRSLSPVAARPSAPRSEPAAPQQSTEPPRSTESQQSAAPLSEPPRVTVPKLFAQAPQACVVVSPTTVRRLVPSATISRNGGVTASTCDYAGKSGSGYRELRVETQIFAPTVSPDPVDDAKVAINSRWSDARDDPVVETVDIKRVSGLGDEAYQRYATDRGNPTVVGEVVVRVRNSLAAVSYVEDAPAEGDGDEVKRRCITEATAVVQEILRAFE